MARPRKLTKPQKVNLYLPLTTKRELYRLANEARRSMSEMVTMLVEAAAAKEAKP